LYFCSFLGIFPFLHRLHFVLLFFRSLEMPSKNKIANSPVVFPFCWRFLPPHGCIFFWGCIFLVLSFVF
jgi:hypothetical protein